MEPKKEKTRQDYIKEFVKTQKCPTKKCGSAADTNSMMKGFVRTIDTRKAAR